jgi:hypothetical protein
MSTLTVTDVPHKTFVIDGTSFIKRAGIVRRPHGTASALYT